MFYKEIKLFQVNLIVFLSLLFSIEGNSQGSNQSDFVFEGEPTDVELILSKDVQIESISGSEKRAGEFLKNVCVENGLHITSMGEDNGNYNFAASLRPLSEGLPNIIFLNHIDVVPPGDLSEWTHPPFSGKITEKYIWGRGSYDNKGSALMQLTSVIELNSLYKNKTIPFNVTFLAVSCEETQCDGGIKYVIDNFLDELNPELVIGEGPPAIKDVLKNAPETDIFSIAVAHKRAFWLKLECEIETTGHGSITPLNYANKEMVKSLRRLTRKKQKAVFTDLNINLLKELGKLEKGFYGYVLKHPRTFKSFIIPQLRKSPEIFALFSNTITLTSLDNDGNNNIVNILSNKSTALLDCRLLPLTSRDDFLKDLKKRLKSDFIKISVITEMPEMPPSKDSNIFYQHLKSVILEEYTDSEVLKVFMPNFGDAGAFRSKGISAFSINPVKIDRDCLEKVHNVNEYMPRGVINKGKSIYVKFIEKCMDLEEK